MLLLSNIGTSPSPSPIFQIVDLSIGEHISAHNLQFLEHLDIVLYRMGLDSGDSGISRVELSIKLDRMAEYTTHQLC